MLRTNFDSGEMRSGANKRAMQRYLIISGHDFRTPRWANMHFIARELAQRGTTRFFSLGCSAALISDWRPAPADPQARQPRRGIPRRAMLSVEIGLASGQSGFRGAGRNFPHDVCGLSSQYAGRIPPLGRGQRCHHSGIRHAADLPGDDPQAQSERAHNLHRLRFARHHRRRPVSCRKSSTPISICSIPSSCRRS